MLSFFRLGTGQFLDNIGFVLWVAVRGRQRSPHQVSLQECRQAISEVKLINYNCAFIVLTVCRVPLSCRCFHLQVGSHLSRLKLLCLLSTVIRVIRFGKFRLSCVLAIFRFIFFFLVHLCVFICLLFFSKKKKNI